ncbi:GSCFA domain-containing protein [Tenacibaculum finnmarkense]|uniref:GSCFA domain-containing protein n=1 Tax=Tenacibaculum finnmarkense TaxID=2781243 RepID=UPI00187B9C45|nr:GSCFA domain-containing protein [Tenacibaculum finnmarkense]MBE7648266.1 GSCFA domain-containing protein [Tenacibaculum finnmarkense genomovar ulcerans]
MKLQTQIPLKKQPHNLIDYNSKLLLLGSCFSENIGDKLSYYKFQSQQNPFGILFHPKAIEKLITDAINEKIYTEKDIFLHNESWHCFDAHSSLSSSDKKEVLNNLNTANTATFEYLKNASHLVITLGTSWVYRKISSDAIVANCHKIPQKNFLKEILTIDEIAESLEAIISLTKSVNPNISIIFTVSPVRHIKDGFIQNQQSKAHLLSAIHQVTDVKNNTYYFPSYEIMMDELRDYRFYAQDMIHPNNTAINYIWEKFIEVWISENTQKTMKEVDIIQKGLAHRSFNPTSEAHQKFLKNIAQKKETLQKAFPFITF